MTWRAFVVLGLPVSQLDSDAQVLDMNQPSATEYWQVKLKSLSY